MHLRWSWPLLVLAVCLCSNSFAQQDPPKSLSQRIQQWMVGRMGLGGLPIASPMGLNPLSITGISGLGGFFGMSPMTTSLLTLMGYSRPQAAQEHPTYVPAPPRYASERHRPALSHQTPVHSVPPPPPPPPPPPARPSHQHHYHPSQSGAEVSLSRYVPPSAHYSSPTQYSASSQYVPPSSAYKFLDADYRSPRPARYPIDINHGLYVPGVSSAPSVVYRGPMLNGEFDKRGRDGRALLFGQQNVGQGIPIAIPRQMIKTPIGGPVAIKTSDGMILGPFSRPVHLHGMPTVGQLPASSGELSSASVPDFLSDSALSLKDMMGVHEHEGSFPVMDHSLSAGIGGDIFADTMKDFDIGSNMGQMVFGDELKTLDIKENLLTGGSTLKHQHAHVLGNDHFIVREIQPHLSTTGNKQPQNVKPHRAILKSS